LSRLTRLSCVTVVASSAAVTGLPTHSMAKSDV
jgi:hypothetical protein